MILSYGWWMGVRVGVVGARIATGACEPRREERATLGTGL